MEWWQYVIGAIAFILVLSLIVIIHEGGHFLMARRAGILCHEFAIGMGPVLFQKKIGETVYSIRAIPLGGFVSMAGEEVEFDALKGVKKVKLEIEDNHIKKIYVDITNPKYAELTTYDLISYDIIGTKEAKDDELFMEVSLENQPETVATYTVNRNAMMYFTKKQMFQIAPYNRNFTNKTIGQRFLAVFAGPFMNFILAIILFAILGVFQGYPVTNSTKISAVSETMPIYQADNRISEDDEILTIEGFNVSGNWDNISTTLSKMASGKTVIINDQEYVYDGLLEVTYKDSSTGEIRSMNVVPNIYVYSVELVFANNGFDTEGKYLLPYVGAYETNNEKTKAYRSGLREGDLITGVRLEGESAYVAINSIYELMSYFSSIKESKKVQFQYTRFEKDNGNNIISEEKGQDSSVIETYSEKLLEASDISQIKLELGISPVYKFNFWKLLYRPYVDTANCVYSIFKTLGLLLNRKANVHIDDFSGPVGIFQLITASASQGILSLVYIAGFLSVNIGFVNLLPFPALDGGRLAFIVYEKITKKRPNAKVENIIHTVGFILLIALFIFISFNDILRLFGLK